MMKYVVGVIVAVMVLAGVTVAVARTWTDRTGAYSVEAEFVSVQNGQVTLKREDGRTVDVPLASLSAKDQAFVRAQVRGASTTGGSTSVSDSAGEWPQWRGPNRDGKSPATGLLTSWPDGGPKLLWTSRGLGDGFSSVAVSGEHIYTMGRKDGATAIICTATDGSGVVWSTPIGSGDKPNCTPTVADGLVYGVTHSGDLACCDAATGKLKWRKSFSRDFGGKMMSMWGYSESPLIDGDRLICTPGSESAVMAALNKNTGEVIWTSRMPYGGRRGKDGAGYSSIVISNAGGVKQYVTMIGRGVIGVNADNGKLLWGYDQVANTTANVPTPIVSGDYVFCSSGYGDGGSALIKLNRRGSNFSPYEVYYLRNNEVQNHHGGMIFHEGHIYMGHGHNKGLPLCLEMESGRIKWGPERGAGTGSAAAAFAEGHMYLRYQNGEMALIEATPERYNLKSSFRIATVNGESWPHPAIANRKLYLRDQDVLHCYDIAAE